MTIASTAPLIALRALEKPEIIERFAPIYGLICANRYGVWASGGISSDHRSLSNAMLILDSGSQVIYYGSMVITKRQRLKLLNALIYFSENTINAGKVKLFKLLYFLDFIHFEKTGRSVTGLEYYAWPKGPVPESLNDEWNEPRPDFNQHLTRLNRSYGTGKVAQAVKARRTENKEIFTDREISIMQALVKKHFRHTAKEMTDASHFPEGPWHAIYEVEGRHQAKIPYELALQGTDDREALLEVAKEHEEMNANYG